MSAPVYNPSVPYTGPTGAFLPGSMVRVQGRVLPTAHSIAINLQTGPGSYDDIALHVNPRFAENLIVRNSRVGGSWEHEERHGPPLPIARDQNFEILILCEAAAFKIAVNGQHFSEFHHRIQPLDRVNHLRVEGDLTITLIQVEGASVAHSTYQPTAPPMAPGYGAGGALPYPSGGGGLPQPGFHLPPTGTPAAAAPYPPPAGGGPYAPPPSAQPYGAAYPPPPQQAGGYYPPPAGGYPAPGGQPGGYYQPGGAAPSPHGTSGSKGGLLDNAGKMLAGGLAGVGLASVANKIPGIGGKSHGHGGGHGYPQPQGYPGGGYPGGGYPGGGAYPQGGGHHSGGGGGGMGPLGGVLGGAAALGLGGLVANKAAKKAHKKNKMLKYGLPVGGAVLGGYALKKGMKGFKHGHGSSSSSSSSSEEE